MQTTFQPSISSDVLSALSALNLALISAEDAGLINGDRANALFSDAVDAAGIDAWVYEDRVSLSSIPQTVTPETFLVSLEGKR